MVYFELARCLFSGHGYEYVFEELAGDRGQEVAPDKSALCRARRRLGTVVMRELFHEVAGPVAESDSCPSAFWNGLRLEALDATL